VPANLQGATGTFNTPAVQITDFDTTKQAYIQADFNAAFSAGGFHTLKVGTGVRKNTNDVDQRFPGGRVTVFWNAPYTSPVPGVGAGRGAYGYYTVDDLGTLARPMQTSSTCARDQWTMGNLTLNLGVRFENEHSVLPAGGSKDVIEVRFGDKIAPRIGAATTCSATDASRCSAATAATTTGRNTSCHADRSAATHLANYATPQSRRRM
jgi:outer membrane receptor protein involved in Fe transport